MKKTTRILCAGLGLFVFSNVSYTTTPMIDTDADLAKKIIANWDHADQRDQILQWLDDSENKKLGSLTNIALVYAAVEMATKQNDLLAYQLLIKRLHSTKSAEEKVDIIGKLSLSAGSEKLSASTLPVFIEAVRPDQMKEVNFRLLGAIKELTSKKPEIASLYRNSIGDLKTMFPRDRKALEAIDSIEALLPPNR